MVDALHGHAHSHAHALSCYRALQKYAFTVGCNLSRNNGIRKVLHLVSYFSEGLLATLVRKFRNLSKHLPANLRKVSVHTTHGTWHEIPLALSSAMYPSYTTDKSST